MGVRTHPLHPLPTGLMVCTLILLWFEAMYGNGCSMYMTLCGIKPYMYLGLETNMIET